MSLGQCIDDLVAEGKMSVAQGARAREIYGEARERHSRSMGPAAAEAAASDDTLAALDFETRDRRRRTLLQMDSQRRALADMARYDGGSGAKPGKAALALLDHDGKAPYLDGNVATQKQAITARAHALMASVLETFDRNLLGEMRNKAQMPNVLRELFGQRTGDEAAAELAQAWTATAEMLRMRFNQAGGSIGKLENWGLPQSHDSLRVREAGFDKWRATIVPLLDRERMQDQATGLPFSDEAFERTLASVHETIRTDGWISREPGKQAGRGALATSRADHRFLIFRGGDEWQAYHDAFGAGGTAFDVMIGHVDDMARDIAHMERLGPNPAATIKWLQDGIEKDAALNGRRDTWTSSVKGGVRAVQRLYDVTSGRTGMPVNAKWANTLGAARSLLVSAKLGGAVFSAISDTGFQAMTRHFNGLPAWTAVTDHLRLMTSAEDRRAAVRLGLIAEEAGKKAAGVQRYLGESITPGVASRLADGVLRVSGLQAWTQTGKWAHGMGELAHLTGLADRSFDALDPRTRASLERYGIDGNGWDAIRTAERLEVRGADFINPVKISDAALGDRLLRMIATETSYAVPEVSARAKAATVFGQPGTFVGEAWRSMLQFKSFGVSMLMSHGSRVMELTPYNRAKYMAGLVATTMLLGGVALQCKEIIKGNGLRSTDDWHFWKDAALLGGGFGIFGDFIGSQVFQQLEKGAGINRAGSLPEAIAGPLVGAVSDAIDLGIVEPIRDVEDATHGGRGGHTAKAFVRDLKSYVPGVNLWPIRTALERMVIDQLQMQIDPNYRRSWAMAEQRNALRGQQTLWKHGEMLPGQAPDPQALFTPPPGQTGFLW